MGAREGGLFWCDLLPAAHPRKQSPELLTITFILIMSLIYSYIIS
jgi:hypothetical protein